MQLRAFDWLLAGSTVALGLALLAAPFALAPRLVSIYAAHGVLEGGPALTRWMVAPWSAPLMAAVPTALAVYCTVTYMRPRRRRVLLAATLLFAVAAVVCFVRGLLGPIFAAAGGAG